MRPVSALTSELALGGAGTRGTKARKGDSDLRPALSHRVTVDVKRCYGGGMAQQPQDLHARREIEDRIIKLGERRRQLQGKVDKNTQNIVDVLPEALRAGIPFDGVAKLIGVPRQTLYRWRAATAYVRNGGRPG